MVHLINPSDKAAFERWVDITAQLLQKYGPAFLAEHEEKQTNNIIDTTVFLLEQDIPLESLSKVA